MYKTKNQHSVLPKKQFLEFTLRSLYGFKLNLNFFIFIFTNWLRIFDVGNGKTHSLQIWNETLCMPDDWWNFCTHFQTNESTYVPPFRVILYYNVDTSGGLIKCEGWFDYSSFCLVFFFFSLRPLHSINWLNAFDYSVIHFAWIIFQSFWYCHLKILELSVSHPALYVFFMQENGLFQRKIRQLTYQDSV